MTEGRNIRIDTRWGALDDNGGNATICERDHRAAARRHSYAKTLPTATMLQHTRAIPVSCGRC